MRKVVSHLITSSLLCIGSADLLAADYIMKISSPAPMTHIDPISAWLEAFESGVESASNGRIDVQLYPASQLGPIPSTVEGVAMGTIEMTLPAVGFFTKLEPRFQVLDANGLFSSELDALDTFARKDVREMLSHYGEDVGVEPLVVFTSGQAVLISKKPITTIADLKGMKIRTGGATALVNDPLKALGVSPAIMPLFESLPGLQTGTIDGALINMAVATGFNFSDVAKYATYIPGGFTVISGVVSRDFMRMLGPELESIVREQAEISKGPYRERLENTPASTHLEKLWIEQGGEFSSFTEEDKNTYKDTTKSVTENIIFKNDQWKRDYNIFKSSN
jgi:C4-dicarboxylate-binding protein DctP|tara:strand:- start:8315 stop:9319 length:1005 start_codon:yes stop_codon:yes gene_type:complete